MTMDELALDIDALGNVINVLASLHTRLARELELIKAAAKDKACLPAEVEQPDEVGGPAP